MTRRPYLIGATAMLLLVHASALFAQGPAEGKWWKRPRIAKQLDLSADQVAQLEKIFARCKPKLIDCSCFTSIARARACAMASSTRPGSSSSRPERSVRATRT